MDQRKLMDNANTITDMAKVIIVWKSIELCNTSAKHMLSTIFVLPQTQNTVYEIVSDMSSRQDAVEERLTNLEDKIQTLQVSA